MPLISEPLWRHGQVEYHLGDGLAGMAELDDASVDFVCTDPPYGMMQMADISKSGLAGLTGSPLRRNIDFDQQTEGEMVELYSSLMTHAARIVKSPGWVLVWLKAERLHLAEEAGTAVGLRYRHPMIWHKTNPVPRIRVQGPCIAHEVAALFSQGPGAFYGTPPSKCHTVITHPAMSGAGRWHPTQKSLPLMRELVEWFSPPDGLVVDPFAGSGQTLRACNELGRRGIGWEIDPKQAEVSALALSGDLKRARALAFEYGILLGKQEDAAESEAQPSLF